MSLFVIKCDSCFTYDLPGAGVEPARCRHHRILSPARLPIPPSRLLTTLFSKLNYKTSYTHLAIIIKGVGKILWNKHK